MPIAQLAELACWRTRSRLETPQMAAQSRRFIGNRFSAHLPMSGWLDTPWLNTGPQGLINDGRSHCRNLYGRGTLRFSRWLAVDIRAVVAGGAALLDVGTALDSMSITERYIRATGSSHLEWDITTRDVDYLVAAGLVRESLATRLVRLRSEFDSVNRASLREADSPLTARLLTLMKLPSLPATRRHLGEYAQREATLRNSTLKFIEIAEVTGKVLDFFLDPTCHVCNGPGFTGKYGAPQIRCAVCQQTGRRLMNWPNDEQEQFARWLQSEIDQKIYGSLARMKRLLRDA